MPIALIYKPFAGVTESKIKESQCRTGMSFGKCGLLSDTGGKETGFIITLAPMCIGVLGYPDLERYKVKVFYHHSSATNSALNNVTHSECRASAHQINPIIHPKRHPAL